MFTVSRETLNNITDFGELKMFCDEIGCCACENILEEDEINAKILDAAVNSDWDSWFEMRDYLNRFELTEGDTGYYVENYWSYEYIGLNKSDLDLYKEDIERFLVDRGYITSFYEDEDDDEAIPENDIALEDMLKGDD